MECNVLEEMARSASSLEYTSGPWNQLLLTNSQIGVCVRESTLFSAKEEKFDYECILAEEDSASESFLNAPDVGTLVGNGYSSTAVKYLLVMGNEYSDKKHYSLNNRPDEIVHMKLTTCAVTRITPEATERINKQDEQLSEVLFKLLRLIHPYIYS